MGILEGPTKTRGGESRLSAKRESKVTLEKTLGDSRKKRLNKKRVTVGSGGKQGSGKDFGRCAGLRKHQVGKDKSLARSQACLVIGKRAKNLSS